MIYNINDNSGIKLASNIEAECVNCLVECKEENEVYKCKANKCQCRRGIKKINTYEIFLCSTENIKSSRLFKEKQKVYENFLYYLSKINNNINQQRNTEVKRLFHDLENLNSHTSQAIYKLIPQDDIGKGGKNQLNNIKNIIQENLEKTAKTFLRILKNEDLVRSEFIAYKCLQNKDFIKPKSHSIQSVIHIVFNTHLSELNKKEINIDLFKSDKYVMLDYSSFSSALVKVFHNISKYILPKSNFKIFIKESRENLEIIMDMISVKIYNDEIEKIFQEGYTGKIPKKLDSCGNGIGLHMARQLLKKNSATIKILNNIDKEKSVRFKCNQYENNQVVITVKKSKNV